MRAETFEQSTCVVSDGNASDAITRFFSGHQAIRTKIDWPLMAERYWNNTDEDGDRKRRRQAEFLVHEFVKWECVDEIGVIDREVEKQVRAILNGHPHEPAVVVRPEWYYT